MQPVRDALDYYRKLNDASKESAAAVTMSSSRQRSVDLLLPPSSSSSVSNDNSNSSPATKTLAGTDEDIGSGKTILAVDGSDDTIDKSSLNGGGGGPFKDDSNSLDR